jgi:hypothetical protein
LAVHGAAECLPRGLGSKQDSEESIRIQTEKDVGSHSDHHLGFLHFFG